jgi:hypothetical protein
MAFEDDVYTPEGGRKLEEIRLSLESIGRKVDKIMADLTALAAQVKTNTDAEASAVTLLTTLSADIAAIKNDPVAIQAMSDQLKASAAALAAAVVANTPAGP